MSETIVRILPLSALIKAINRATYEFHGRAPTRVVACPVQVDAWARECQEWAYERGVSPPYKFTIMAAEVFEGAHDAAPELIWAVPIAGDA